MKISKYTFLFYHQDNYYAYNSLSNALISLDKENYDLLCEYQKQKDIECKIDQELFAILLDKRVIVENDFDEFLLYRSIVENNRAQDHFMHLTIAPTLDCNFNCHYCFEKKEKTYMSSEVIDSTIKYITSKEKLKTIKLTWFGGEPLMAIDQIKEFYVKFRKAWSKNFSSNIITTGYYITPDVIEILKFVEIESMQITLDGNKDSHNKIKQTEGCDDVFIKIIHNIDLILKLAPEIHITIRVNITRENVNEYGMLYNYLYKRYIGKNIYIAPAIVEDRGNCDYCTGTERPFLSRKEFTEFMLNLYNKQNIHSPNLEYPNRFFYECAIRNKMAIGVDPDGYVYKCWEVIGNKQYAIGKLEEGEIKDINITMLNRQLYGADPISDKKCSKCAYLPICNGGCPIHRIENEFAGGSIDTCSFYKGYLPEFMKVHLALKKRI